MSGEVRRTRGKWFWPSVVLVVLLAGSVAAFLVSARMVREEEERLLQGETRKVGAVLEGSFERLESQLQVLGHVGAVETASSPGTFARSAEPLLEGTTVGLGVATEQGPGFTVTAAVGDGPGVGDELAVERAALAGRALSEGEMVSDLVPSEAGSRLLLARPVEGTRTVSYLDVAVSPDQPTPTPPDSPFSGLRVALYASPRVQPARLVLTTYEEVPLTGRVDRAPLSVGADTWTLEVAAPDAFVGSVPIKVPWFLLGGGVVMAVLASGVVLTVTRRRSYALALVDERTRELERTRVFLENLLTVGPAVVVREPTTGEGYSYISPNLERLLGINRSGLESTEALWERVHPEDLGALRTCFARVAQDSSTQETTEFRLRHGDDSYRWVEAVIIADPDEQSDAPGLLVYLIDVDERRRAEEARREAQEAAEAANRSKSGFLSRMSHELRTPLNAVLGFGQLLELEDLSETSQDAVAQILKGGSHLLDLINEVLDISRVETGDLALSPEAVHVGELVQETVDLARPLADQRGVQLVIDRSGGCDGYAFADRQRAKQILLNLISNGVKYNRARGTVALSCENDGDAWIRLHIADTGPGIPSERLDRLFTPFERLGAEHTGEDGTGIGLALAKRLAEAMGGTLTVDSRLGEGSTFSVDLPRVEGPVERYERLNGDSEREAAGAAGPSQRPVLYIEDNLSNLRLVERILAQRPDVDVVGAMQGRLGLELAREHQPTLVLLDLHLPDMGGEEVLRRLRDDPATASIPVVIVSADATHGQVQRLLSLGASGYLTKPINVRELLRLLDETLVDT